MERQVPKRPPSLLILEDDPIIAELFGTLFSFEGYETRVAESVVEGIRMLDADPPSVVLLDLMMPNTSGLEFCHYVREQSATPHIPIVVVSAMNSLEDIEAATDAGADTYLTKPVPNRMLVDTVQKLVLNPTKPSWDQPRSSLELEVRRAVVQTKLYLAEIRRSHDLHAAAAAHASRAEQLTAFQKQDLLRQAADEYRRIIKDNETAAWDILGAIFKRLELRERAISRQSRHRPIDAEGWALASSRASFVLDDCRSWAETSPDQILGEYEFALAGGDDIYAFLLERCGLPALQAAGAWAELERFQRTVYEANPPEPTAAAELEAYYEVLNPLRTELSKIRPPEGVVLVQPAQRISAPAAPAERANGRHRPGTKPLPRLPDPPATDEVRLAGSNGHRATAGRAYAPSSVEATRRA